MKSVSRRIRKRPKNAKSLSKVVTEILSKSKAGYPLAQPADKVLGVLIPQLSALKLSVKPPQLDDFKPSLITVQQASFSEYSLSHLH